uniref:N-acetyltransferase domain-containing protein n=1 Tax=Stomoxys calcitrans TaxID=35570 RepID=A0A1I8Q446_STOCA
MSLVQITQVQAVRKLRDVYLKDWPQHCVGFYCLDNFYNWMNLDGNNKHLKIYTVSGEDGANSGLYVIVDRYQLFCGSLNTTDCTKLTNALEQLDWSLGFKVSSFRECHRPSVLSVVQSKGLQCEYDSLTLLYYMPCDIAKQLEIGCPQGFYVKPLSSASDAEVIDTLWPNRHDGSLFLIRRLIDWNTNMGVYVEGTNELVAWCLRLQGGFLGALQVKDNYQRLGLGSVVTRATSLRLAEQGNDVMALVNEENRPSRGMFEKLGFTVTDRCYWLRTYPTVENFAWPDGE